LLIKSFAMSGFLPGVAELCLLETGQIGKREGCDIGGNRVRLVARVQHPEVVKLEVFDDLVHGSGAARRVHVFEFGAELPAIILENSERHSEFSRIICILKRMRYK
jgi:hypothetical protein